MSNGLRTKYYNFTLLVCLDLYCGACLGSYLRLVFHDEYTDKVYLQGIGVYKISFSFLNGHLCFLSLLLTLGLRKEKDNKD